MTARGLVVVVIKHQRVRPFTWCRFDDVVDATGSGRRRRKLYSRHRRIQS